MTGDGALLRVFVTGTDTGVGKTVVSAVLAAGLSAIYWKPVQSGLDGPTDTDLVREMTGLPADRFLPEAWTLKEPLSPHAAAALEGRTIRLSDFSLPETAPEASLVVEGAGGIMVPINDRHFMLDVMERLGLPVVLVCRSGLGTINHSLLSLAALRGRNIPVLGAVMNGPPNPGNREAIEAYGKIPVLAELPPLASLAPGVVRQAFHQYFRLPQAT
ncbi:MAG: dethiobiotin synthase [Thermodesulfobacteriota bacterium]